MTDTEPKNDNPMPQSRNQRLLVFGVLVVTVAVIGVAIAALLFTPRYLHLNLKNPDSIEERQALAKRVAEDRIKLQAGEPVSLGIQDEDALSIIWAIQAYRLHQKKQPKSIRDLLVAGVFGNPRALEKYEIESDEKSWKLRDIQKDRIVAAGN